MVCLLPPKHVIPLNPLLADVLLTIAEPEELDTTVYQVMWAVQTSSPAGARKPSHRKAEEPQALRNRLQAEANGPADPLYSIVRMRVKNILASIIVGLKSETEFLHEHHRHSQMFCSDMSTTYCRRGVTTHVRTNNQLYTGKSRMRGKRNK